MEENLLLVPAEEMPITDKPKKEKKVSINILQENLLKLMNRDKVELAEIQKATGVPWGSLYGFFKGSVQAQLLDLNIKELSDFFDVSVDFLAFGISKYKFDTFDRDELRKLKEE
jgi:hypothetical protein